MCTNVQCGFYMLSLSMLFFPPLRRRDELGVTEEVRTFMELVEERARVLKEELDKFTKPESESALPKKSVKIF